MNVFANGSTTQVEPACRMYPEKSLKYPPTPVPLLRSLICLLKLQNPSSWHTCERLPLLKPTHPQE